MKSDFSSIVGYGLRVIDNMCKRYVIDFYVHVRACDEKQCIIYNMNA